MSYFLSLKKNILDSKMQDSWESAPEEMWLGQAKFEAYKHKSMRYQRGRGTCVLFILDFSESMRGEGIKTLKRAVSDILDEFSKHPELDENVAVIVFGKETKFLQYYSNRYTTINQSIEDLEPIGASPLTAAFLLALGGLYEGSASTHVVGDFLLPPRVVVFTDGRLTNFADNGAKEHEADFFPSHQSLLHTISIKSKGGQMLDTGRARWFGRYTLHYRTADTIYRMTNKTIVDRGILNNFVQSIMNGQAYQEEDLDKIRELLNNRAQIMVDQVYDDEDSEDEFYKEKYTVPRVGTRVRRGPHWIYENQDCESAGTIV
ncbi:uncharacterized protein [Magallana gigas]|uniref:uncharacterized protein isoform X3 n=1 Tax=Magallana gigas TaxID=29159 RepID=UPI00333FFE35